MKTCRSAIYLALATFCLLAASCKNPTTSDSTAAVVELRGLSLSVGTLSPAFSSSVTAYSASVASSVASVTIVVSVADPDLEVTVKGTSVLPGAGTATIALDAGNNVIPIAVTYGSTTKTYTLTVARAAVELSGLSLSVGTLSPAFSSSVTSYTASVANSEASISITPTTANSSYTVKVNGVVVASASTSQAINLVPGSNSISVTVSDGTSTTTYTLTVTRASAPKLSGLSLTDDMETEVILSPSFTEGTTAYDTAVGTDITGVTVTAAVANSSYTVEVNGTPLTLTGSGVRSGTSGVITLVTGDNDISIVVSDGTATATYTVTVNRPEP